MLKSLAVAVIPAVAVAALASAGIANAAPAPFPGHHFKVPTALSATEHALPGFHRGVKITGTLSEDFGWRPLAGETVSIDAVRGRHLTFITSATTDRRGQVSWDASPDVRTTYELVFDGTRQLDPSVSSPIVVRPHR